jgi:hypothetical protein
MHFWGFSSHPTNDSPTQFAKYDNQTPDELESKYDAYKRLNAKVLNEGLPNKEAWKVDADAPIVQFQEMIGILRSFDEIFEVKNP